jgi:hypothetical protein
MNISNQPQAVWDAVLSLPFEFHTDLLLQVTQIHGLNVWMKHLNLLLLESVDSIEHIVYREINFSDGLVFFKNGH